MFDIDGTLYWILIFQGKVRFSFYGTFKGLAQVPNSDIIMGCEPTPYWPQKTDLLSHTITQALRFVHVGNSRAVLTTVQGPKRGTWNLGSKL